MKSYRLRFMIFLFICTTLFVVSSSATNFYERHGNNFIYLDLESTSPNKYDTLSYAPVIWDIRTAFFELRNYYASYGWESSSGCDSSYNAIDLLMKEAWDHGVNFANSRGEIMRMDTTDLLNGPDSSDYFVNVAEIVREDSLHLIAGGFKTDTSEASDAHNDAVISYLSEYKDSSYVWSDGPGEFIGVFGFDEPDLGYEGPGENQCLSDTAWSNLVRNYAQDSRDFISGDILPFGTFLCRWKTKSGDTLLYYQETIPLFSEELEYPVFDYYPCKYSPAVDRSYPDQIEFDEIIGATNLMPSGSIDYEAFADQDEIFAVDSDGWFRVFEFENVTSRTDTLEVSRIDSVQLPASLRTDPVWAASDFRAADVGDRDSNTHRLNGAVVFFGEDDPGENMVIFHDGSDIVFLEDALEMPANAWEMTTVCVGEYNYPMHHLTDSLRRGTLISHGELRILACYQLRRSGVIYDRARIFAWNYDTEEFDDVTGDSQGLSLDIEPVKAVWGVFWPTNNYWSSYNSDDQSGFLIIDSIGNYQSIYEYIPQDRTVPEWTVSDEFTNLFEWDETSFIARQTKSFPCFTAGMDYICHLTAGVLNKAILEFASDPGRNPNTALTVYESSPFDLPEPYDFSHINDAASFRPMRFYDDALLVSCDYPGDSSAVYRTTSHIDFRGGDDISISLNENEVYIDILSSDDSPLLSAARVYNVRQTYRVPIVFNPLEGVYPSQVALLYGDIPVESSSDYFADMHVAMDTMFVYGIDGTPRSNCLMHNLRCEGRRQDGQVTFYPPSDTLLYLMTTSLVHGSRGIHMRALDFTMMCGNGGGSAQVGTYRCPPLLLNWGPGVETTNPDMIGRLLNVVQSLTGKGTSDPDFMSALIDDDYAVLDTNEAQNAVPGPGGWQPDPDNHVLNFIVLEDSLSEDLLLLAVNDSNSDLDYDQTYIYFPTRDDDSFTKNHIAGFDCDPDTLRSETKLRLDFFTMPAYSASLYLLEYLGGF